MFFKHVKGLEEQGEDQSNIMLFLLAFGDGTVEQKQEYLIHLLQWSEKVKTEGKNEPNAPSPDNETISRTTAAEILQKLLHLISVEILEAIQGLEYLTLPEMYTKDELDKIKI